MPIVDKLSIKNTLYDLRDANAQANITTLYNALDNIDTTGALVDNSTLELSAISSNNITTQASSFYNIEAYHTGNSSDYTQAIKTAIQQAHTNGVNYVVFNAETIYEITEPIDLYENITLIGNGATIKSMLPVLSPSNNDSSVSTYANTANGVFQLLTNAHHCTISNFIIDTNRSRFDTTPPETPTSYNCGIYVNACADVIVEKCVFEHNFSKAIYFKNISGACAIRDCRFKDPGAKQYACAGEFVAIGDVTTMNHANVEVCNNHFTGNISTRVVSEVSKKTALYGTCAILVSNFYGRLLIDNNAINNCGRGHIGSDHGPTDHRLSAIDLYMNVFNTTISNNTIRSICGGLNIRASENIIVENNQIEYCGHLANETWDNVFGGDPFILITGGKNAAGDHEYPGKNLYFRHNVVIGGTYAFNPLILVRNGINGIDDQSPLYNEPLQYMENVYISENIIKNTESHALQFDSSINNLIISNNTIIAKLYAILCRPSTGTQTTRDYCGSNIEIIGNNCLSDVNPLIIDPVGTSDSSFSNLTERTLTNVRIVNNFLKGGSTTREVLLYKCQVFFQNNVVATAKLTTAGAGNCSGILLNNIIEGTLTIGQNDTIVKVNNYNLTGIPIL